MSVHTHLPGTRAAGWVIADQPTRIIAGEMLSYGSLNLGDDANCCQQRAAVLINAFHAIMGNEAGRACQAGKREADAAGTAAEMERHAGFEADGVRDLGFERVDFVISGR